MKPGLENLPWRAYLSGAGLREFLRILLPEGILPKGG